MSLSAALEDTTPPHSKTTALPAEALSSAPFPQPPAAQPVSISPSDFPIPPSRAEPPPSISPELQIPPVVQNQPAPSVGPSSFTNPSPLPHTSANVPDVSQHHETPLADALETSAHPDTSQPPSHPPAEGTQPSQIPPETPIPASSSEPLNLAEASTIDVPKEMAPADGIDRFEAEERAPSDGTGPSKTTPGMVDACSQIEPGELHFPLLVLAAVPPHLLQYSIGGDPNPPAEIAVPEAAPAAVTVESPASVAPTAEPVVDQAPSAGAGMEVALVPVPYLVRTRIPTCSRYPFSSCSWNSSTLEFATVPFIPNAV